MTALPDCPYKGEPHYGVFCLACIWPFSYKCDDLIESELCPEGWR